MRRRGLLGVFFIFVHFFCIPSFATPTEARLDEIKGIISRLEKSSLFERVQMRANPQLPGPAVTWPPKNDIYVIEYNPEIFSSLSQSAQDFIIYHELGHIYLGHADLQYPGPEAAKELEFEADSFAALLFKKMGKIPDEGLKAFFGIVQSMTQTIPPGPERVKLCESLLLG